MPHFKTTRISESTKKQHERQLDRWLSLFDTHPGIEFLVKYPRESLRVLKEAEEIKDTPTNRHGFISAIVAYILHEKVPENHDIHIVYYDKWREIQKSNNAPNVERWSSGRPSELQKNKEIKWADVIRVRDELPMGATKLLLGFYTYIEPVRADLYDCEIRVPRDDETLPLDANYLLIGPKAYTLVLQDYKTKKVYGKNEIVLPDELCHLFDAYMTKVLADDDRFIGWLFENERGEPHTRTSFSNWAKRQLTKAFGRPVTLTAIRHAFVSQIDFNAPIAELKAHAKAMGHSVGTQRFYKWEEKTNVVVVPEETKKDE